VALSNRDRVGRALEVMAGGLEPFVDRQMAVALPSGRDWLQAMTDRAQHDGRSATMVRSDPRLPLQVIGEHGRAFRDSLSKTQLAFAQEIRESGHKWAHNDAFSDPDTSRVLDTIKPSVATVAALIIPQGLLDRLAGRARNRQNIARRKPVRWMIAPWRRSWQPNAAWAVTPESMVHNNPGYDIRSRTPTATGCTLRSKDGSPERKTSSSHATRSYLPATPAPATGSLWSK
jgi:hypothetical protein